MTINEILNKQTAKLRRQYKYIPLADLYRIAETRLVALVENGEMFGIKRERMLEFLQEEAV